MRNLNKLSLCTIIYNAAKLNSGIRLTCNKYNTLFSFKFAGLGQSDEGVMQCFAVGFLIV